MAVLLLSYAALAPAGWAALPAAFLVAVASSVLVVTLQLRLMSVAGQAQTLGAAMNHSSPNIGNALGAWLGGHVIAAGWGYRAPSLVGVVLALAGLTVLLLSAVVHRRRVVPG
jgi:DHA1 family inner membrane transport protein